MVDTRYAATKSHSREWLFCVLLCLCLLGCARGTEPVQLAGSTMGTTWHVTYMAAEGVPEPGAVERAVQAELDALEQIFSTYRDDSEISRFNRAPAAQWIELSEAFAEVLRVALQVGEASGGAYDVTVAPLVELWGFGPGQPVFEPPAASAIAAALVTVGSGGIALDANLNRASKERALSLDFSSLAKGYAVDRIAATLTAFGVDHYLAEVGGEMKVAGSSPRGDAWRVAIESPDSAGRSVAEAIRLSDRAVATSGDYRNFFEYEGVRYSHSIDPRSGYPVLHDLVSVTVVHESAMWADAWATALIVLGSEGAATVAQARDLAVYFIRRREGEFEHSHSPAFAPYLEPAESEEKP